jgi:hypothetical protein
MWTTLKKRCPHAHSPNKCKCQQGTISTRKQRCASPHKPHPSLTAQGIGLVERRDAFEFCRDYAAECYEAKTGSAWRPRAGSMLNHRTLTSAMIDSREFIAARRRAETELLVPVGTRIAFTGGTDCNDHQRIWSALDRVHAKHPDMVLLHGGSPRGAERIASRWADHRKVAQVVFKPDWTRHAKAAPFKRNDAMLEALPAGLIAFPGADSCDCGQGFQLIADSHSNPLRTAFQ